VTGARSNFNETICDHSARLIIFEIVNSEGKAMSSVLDKQFIFIIGAPKSGTTWLQIMIGAHPQVCTTVDGDDYWVNLLRDT